MSEAAVKRRRIRGDSEDPPTIVDLNLKLLEDEWSWDVVFLVGQAREKIGANKRVLMARSPVFEAKFSERWANSATNPDVEEIVVEDVEPSIFRSFLQHIYTYAFSANSPVEAVKLLSLAQYYGVKTLVKPCEELLVKAFLQPDNFLDIFASAKESALPHIMTKAGDAMARYFTQLAISPTFEKVDEATLMYLLRRDDLCVKEFELFSILLRWADMQIENSMGDPQLERNDVLKNLLSLVRFPTMTAEEFAKIVARTNVFSAETQSDLYTYIILGRKAREELPRKLPFSSVRRVNDMVSIHLYEEKPRPGTGTFPTTALKKRSNIQDIMTFKFFCFGKQVKVISLVLDPPMYGEAKFQNSSTVAAMNLPIRVAVSLSEINDRDYTSIGEEVVADLSKGQMILLVDDWVLSNGNAYKITLRLLSEAYTVPDAVRDGSQDQTNLNRDGEFDFFRASSLRRSINFGFGVFRGTYGISHLCVRGGIDFAGVSAVATAISSGLHLLRSIQITEV